MKSRSRFFTKTHSQSENKSSRLGETLNLSTCVNSSTNIKIIPKIKDKKRNFDYYYYIYVNCHLTQYVFSCMQLRTTSLQFASLPS